MTSARSRGTDGLTVVYDGQCPFCTAYTRLLRLENTAGKVTLVDARDRDHPIMAEIHEHGLDLDEGLVLRLDGRLYHGADCMSRLAMLSTGSDTFNRINRWLFRHPGLTRLLYPPLRFGRNTTLRLLGRRKISEQNA